MSSGLTQRYAFKLNHINIKKYKTKEAAERRSAIKTRYLLP
jgi:hypothetical protein